MKFAKIEIFKHRELITAFVARELKIKYKGSLLGIAWSFITPLFLLVVYTVLFSKILQLKLGADTNTADYALYIFCGMIPWLAFSESVNRNTTIMFENVSLIKKTVFPIEILPLNIILANIVNSFFSIIILLVGCLFFNQKISVFSPLIIFVMLPQIFLTLGISWFISCIAAYIKDARHITSLLTLGWMFITPIFYPESIVPEKYRIFLNLNPMTYVVREYRNILLGGHFPNLEHLLILYIVGLVFLAFGYLYMARAKVGLAELI